MASGNLRTSNNSTLGVGRIVVIADDFTGAAELAGISLCYGLKVELCVEDVEYRNADVLVVSTDSRSLNKNEAIVITERIVKQVLQLKPGWIYKKIDSVLRGYVMEEAKVQMRLMNKTKAFIMPANPSLGRTIINGEYLVNGIRINKTAFATDPEFPIKSSSIKEILNNEVELMKPGNEVEKGIMVGEVAQFEDYQYWVNHIDNETVLIGAGDFYVALLNKFHKTTLQQQFHIGSPHLYICGTALKQRRQQIEKLNCVLYLPEVLNEGWFERVSEIIRKHKKAIIAIDESSSAASQLRATMAKAGKEIVQRQSIKEIFIEGGSTAAAVLQELKIKKLEPKNELERGVVRMKANDLFMTVKPGSYELPKQIKQLYSINT